MILSIKIFEYIKKQNNILLFVIEKIRKWLERNGIFFTAGTSVLLSAMAIIVSVQANKLVSYQNKLISLEYIPEFSINLKSYYDPYDINQKVTSEELNIFNNGGYYYDTLNPRVINFLNLKITNKGKIKEIKLPIRYYFFTTISDNKAGFVGRIFGNDNNKEKFIELYKFTTNFTKTNVSIPGKTEPIFSES